MQFVLGINSLICGFFSVLLFACYFASIMIGESSWFTVSIIIGIAGLVFGAIMSRNVRIPGLPSWRTNPFHFSLVMAGLYFLTKDTILLLPRVVTRRGSLTCRDQS